MAKLYSNENYPLPAVEALRALGHDVLTTLDMDKAGQAIPDEAVLAFAINQQRAVLTINRKDFIRLHLQNPNHAGIIVCTFDANFAGQAQRIHSSIAHLETLQNQLIRINRPQSKT